MSPKRPSDSVSKGLIKRKKIQQQRDSSEDETDPDETKRSHMMVSSSQGPLEAEAGIIESVTLENFMCHQKLHFTFGSNVNFITGRNGSGKSAILTGIVLGLGGRANATSRGQSVKSFIKTGKTFAIIEIILRNRGCDAFKASEYGEKIIIERRISSDGSSAYKLKNSKGKIVANKKDELTRILDQFNIQVDNPVSILNQETSRNFLNSTDKRDKYKFFARATQIEEIKNNYESAATKHQLAIDRLTKKEEILPILKRDMNAREKEWLNQQGLEKQRNQIELLRRQYVWSFVIEKEKEVLALKQKKEKYQNGLSNLDEKIKIEDETIANAEKEKEESRLGLKKLDDEMTEFKPRFSELKKMEATLKSEKRVIELAMRKIQVETRTLDNERADLSTRIEEMKTAGNQDYSEERRRREEEIERLTLEMNELRAKLPTTQNDYEQVAGSIKHYKDELFNYQQEERNINRQIENLKKNLSDLEASRSNKIRRFGRSIPEVLKRVDAAHKQGKFIKKPIGPIGNYVEILDPELALAAECCVGGVMTAFCCDNRQDEEVLLEIFRTTIRDGPKPPIIVTQFRDEIYDVREHAVRTNEHRSVLQTLSIRNAIIANCLIDQCEIESVLLVKDSPTARQLMLRNPPPKCKLTYTGNGDMIYPAPDFRFYSSTKNNVRFLSASVEENIDDVKRRIEDLNSQKPALKDKIKETNNRVNQDSRYLREYEVRLKELRKDINHLNLRINELKNVEDPEPPNFAILEEDLKSLELRRNNLDENLVDARKDFKEIDKRLLDVQKEMSEIRSKIDEFHNVCEPLKEKFANLAEVLRKREQIKIAYAKKIEEVRAGIIEIDGNLIKTRAEAAELERNTAEVGERVCSEKSQEALEREIGQLEKHLDREETRVGTRENVLARYQEAKMQYVSILSQIDQYKEIINMIKRSLIRRDKAFKYFRKCMEERIKYLFLTCLSTRNYRGKIVIDHNKGTLDLLVQPSEDVNQLNTDMKSLSGGERSYSTVCLILALWDAIENPFRILDEYDVFMDMVNRKVSMEMMLETASENCNHQFIFLTPLDMPITKKVSNMKICRMPDPDRGETSTT